ncbi:MAG: hypothetical protein RLZZ338_2081 [Cyanobacteriota bacterium]|jgi:PAS domain S-box-containing protein
MSPFVDLTELPCDKRDQLMTTTILIVDDSQTERDTYRGYLTKDRPDTYRILEAETLKQGLNLCWEEKPDAILLDFELTNGDGLEFLQQLKERGYPHPLPVIMLTGQGDLIIAIQAMKRGAYDYLVKSTLNSEMLQNTLDNLLALMNMIAERTQAKIALQESEAQFQRIAALLPGAIYIFVQRLDGSTYLEYMSAMGEEIMELTVEEVLHNMHLSYDTIHPDFRRANLASETDATETMQPFQYEYQINVDSGKTKWLQANARAVKRENGEIAWYGVLCDISDRKQTEKELLELNQSLELRVSQRTGELQAREKQLRELSERLALSLKSGAIGCWEWDIRHDLLTWDERMYELYGVKPSKPNKNYAFWINRLHPDDRAIIEANFEKALVDQAEFNTEYRVIYPDGSIHFIESYSLIQRDEEGKPQSMIGINLDVSSRKQAEELIRQQVERESLLREITQRIRESLDLKTIFETATQEIREFLDADRVAILQFSHDSNFVDSEFVAESVINGFTSALGEKFQDHCFREKYHRDYQQGKIQAVNDIYENGIAQCLINILAQFHVRASLIVPLLKGTELWGLLCIHQCDGPRSWQPLEIDLLKQIASQLTIAIQQASLYQQVQNELEENNQLFLQLTRELEQKKILLKEIHHRVKNNLQVMSSIMYLQFGKASPEIKALSEEYQNRLQSIAVLHEQLYRGNNLSDIDISQYITTLSKNLFQCYAIDSALITLKMEVNEIYLPLDQSIPLGLIMNELISNALKHAFPQGQGEITISLIESEKQISLTIADNGIGLPTDFDPEKTDTLGMQLIISFTQQLEGELTCNSKNGSIFQITFPSL